MLKKTATDHEDLVQCPVCDSYLKRNEGFTCARCRRGVLCQKHRIEGTRECASCVFDRKNRDLTALREQEINLRGVVRLFQFIFLVFAVFFIAIRLGLGEMVELLQNSIITEGLPYLGIASACGYIAFYIILFSQKGKARVLETEMKKIEFKR